jgi:predicted RNA binding protein YcfA (HicA-like mRNA interferase family)
MRWPELRRVLERKPLEYEVVHQSGSHRKLTSRAGFPELNLAFHDRQELAPGLVRKVLVGDVGLSESDALGLI